MKWYIYGWLHSFDYHGRATLTQFWTFNFFHAIAVVLCYGLENWIQPDMSILQLYTTLALVSNLAAIVRRLHDTGRTGWWCIVGLFPLIGWLWLLEFLIDRSEMVDNRWGAYEITI